MTLPFHPRAGQVLICDFSSFKEPEMTKVRPVIVISPKLPHRSRLVAIVPISLTAPTHNLPYVFKLSKNYHPKEDDTLACWAKADMVTNLSTDRLSGFRVGRRKWDFPALINEDLRGVRMAVLCGLGLDRLLTGDK